MDKKKLKIYTASSVGVDYFFFLNKTIIEAGFDAEPLFLVTEDDYRRLTRSNGVKKFWLRIKMYVFYPLMLIYKGFKSKNGSIFIVSSNTFYAPYLVHSFLRIKNIKVIHMLYDLFPDALEIAGSIKQNSFISKLIGEIIKKSQSKCDATIFLGEFLRKHAETRWGSSKSAKVIDISTDLTMYNTHFQKLGDSEKIIIHYGGQLGHLHDANSIIASIKYVCKSDISEKIEFNFYVSGAQAEFLKESLKEYPVKIISAIPSNQWRRDINNFHIGLVSLSPGGASVCLPSKTYGMMAGGMAILAICPQWSDLGNLVTSLNAGWVINNSPYTIEQELYIKDYQINIKYLKEEHELVTNFYNCLKSIIENRDLLEDRRKNAFEGVRLNHNIQSLSNKWGQVISKLGE
jgi:hypothetical protein